MNNMNVERLPRVDEIVITTVKKAFDSSYIIKREDLNAEQKIAYMMAIEEVTNFLETCRNENQM